MNLAAHSPLVGRTIGETAIRNRTGAAIVGVIRNNIFGSNPKADYCFGAEDMVAVVGSRQEREAFKVLATTVN